MKSMTFALCLISAAWAQVPASQPMQHDHSKHQAENLPPADPATKDSLYQLEPALKDQQGQPMALAVFKGRPVLIAMFFASCTSVCPLIISDIQRFEKGLTEAERAQLGVILVSFDDVRDGPQAFEAIIKRHQIDATRWRLATTPAADVRLLAAALGIRYTKEPDGGYVHSATLTLLNRAGEVAARTEGILQPVDGLIQTFRGLASQGEEP